MNRIDLKLDSDTSGNVAAKRLVRKLVKWRDALASIHFSSTTKLYILTTRCCTSQALDYCRKHGVTVITSEMFDPY